MNFLERLYFGLFSLAICFVLIGALFLLSEATIYGEDPDYQKRFSQICKSGDLIFTKGDLGFKVLPQSSKCYSEYHHIRTYYRLSEDRNYLVRN